MATMYEIPGGLAWCKEHLKIIIGNKDLYEIMQFGDLWRSRGHKPLVHVISPSMDNGRMWDQHEDPSGLLDNVPAHIDLFIVDFYNLNTPEIPSMWDMMRDPPKWLLWEYKAGKVRFNGDKAKFISTFGIDPSTTPTTPPSTDTGGTTTPPATSSGEVIFHMVCPHCGKQIF